MRPGCGGIDCWRDCPGKPLRRRPSDCDDGDIAGRSGLRDNEGPNLRRIVIPNSGTISPMRVNPLRMNGLTAILHSRLIALNQHCWAETETTSLQATCWVLVDFARSP